MSRVVPSGATSAAACSSAVLYDAARRLPEIPRIRIGLGGLDGRDVDQQLDVVGDEHVAVGERLVPLVSTVETSTVPASTGASPEASTVPSKPRKLPRTVAMPMCSSALPSSTWALPP